MSKQFATRAKAQEDPDVQKFAEASQDLDKVCAALNQYQEDAEAIAVYVGELAKNGPDKQAEDKDQALKDFEMWCGERAKQCDSWRKSGDEHAKNAALKVADVQGKLMRDPSEWDI